MRQAKIINGEDTMGQLGFFDVQDRLASLSKLGDPLEKLNQCIDWDYFAKTLRHAINKDRSKEPAGRPPFDYLMMFKVLVLQSLYNVSDHQMEFQIRDRLSFMRFLDLSVEDRIPDEKTIWLFREKLTRKGLIDRLFKRFNRYLDRHGFHAKKGMIVDASIVEVPVQRNSREENEAIKTGKKPADWDGKDAKCRQKDVDASWTSKHGKKYYGYKDHVNVDVKHKLIRKYEVTPSNTHDSQVFDDLLDRNNTNQSVWADSAYSSEAQRKSLKRKRMIDQIHKKGYRNHPLSVFQEKLNTRKSTIRARVEHVFGFMANTMNAKFIRCIGLVRAKARIGMTNLVYNMCRYVQIASFA